MYYSVNSGRAKLLTNSNSLRSILANSIHIYSLTTRYLHSNSYSLPEKFSGYLDNCTDITSLKKLHACMFAKGLVHNAFLQSKLLNSYSRFNLLPNPKWIFTEIVNNKFSSLNSIFPSYFRADQFSEVLRLYVELRQRNVKVHSSAITCVLKSCIERGSFDFGCSVHASAVRIGLNENQYWGSSLIVFYSKFDCIHEAAKVFDEIVERDLVVYTSMITGYAQSGDLFASKAFEIAYFMQRDGFEPNRVAFVSLLQAASSLGALEQGKSIHGYAVRRGIGFSDEVFETSLLDMYVKCSDPCTGRMVLGETNKRNIGSWNALLAGYYQSGLAFEALDLLCQMVEEKCKPDLITLANGLSCCAELRYILIGKSIHCHMLRSGIQVDIVAVTALIDMYAKCKQIDCARKVFDRTDNKDVVLFNVMISGYVNNGFVCTALEVFQELLTMNIRPNTSTFLSVLTALSDMQDTCKGKSIHGYLLRHGLEANIEVANQLMNMYAKCGFVESARKCFERIKVKDMVSWTSMMMCYVNSDLSGESIFLFRSMQRENVTPDLIAITVLLQALNQLGSVSLVKQVHSYIYRTFMERDISILNSLITTYSRFGKFDMARNLFEHMKKRDLSSWNTMIASHGMHGDCVQALKLFDQMKMENVKPDNITFKSILSACSHSGFVEQGLSIFRSMEVECGVVPTDEHYCCVVDLLGRAGRLVEAYDFLKGVTLRQNVSALGSLLAACRVHGDMEMGERIRRLVLEMEPQGSSLYSSVANLYAGGENWEGVEDVGDMAKEKGLRRISGYSLVDF